MTPYKATVLGAIMNSIGRIHESAILPSSPTASGHPRPASEEAIL